MKFTPNAFQKSIIVICSSLLYCIITGTIRLNSQLFVVVRELFGVDRGQASLPFTLLYSVRNLSGPVVGFIGNKIGLRCTTVFGCLVSSVSLAACFLVKDIIHFTILWGIAFGIGFGLSTMLIPKILQLYFTKSFNLVQGIFLSSGSMGSFVFPAVGEYLLQTYGTSGIFLILSGFALHTVPLAMLLECPETSPEIKNDESSLDVSSKRKERLENHEIQKKVASKDSNQDSMETVESLIVNYYHCHAKNPPQDSINFIYRNFNVFFDSTYILLCISLSLIMIPVLLLHTIMVDAWRDKGVSEDVTILMAFAIGDLLGRLGFGFLSDFKCTSPLNIYALTGGICGLLLIGFPWLNGFYAMVVFYAIVGVLMGGIVVTPTGVIRDYIEKENLTMAFSSRDFLFGLLFLTQPSVIGYFRTTLQSYDGLFYFFGSLCIFGIVIALCVPMAARYQEKRRNKKKGAVQSFVKNVR